MEFFSDFILLLQQSPLLAMVAVGILGLCVGSFLNVVIHRMPLMMEQHFLAESRFALQDELQPALKAKYELTDYLPEKPITLSRPASRCPQCNHQIRWYENIPVVSWLALRGKCSKCHNPIGVRYPLVEIITAILSVLVVIQFGVTLQALMALFLVWTLIALTGIDFDTQLLPDRLTLPLAGLGLVANAFGLFITPTQAIWGYVIGFLCLWLVYILFLVITGKRGMGHGDFKLLAALGAWLGPLMLPIIILLSSVVGAIVGIVLMKRAGESKPFAFGPYIAIAGIIALLYGKSIMQWYLN